MGEPFVGRTPGEDGLVVWFAQADRNHDGVLTADEMTADADRFFSTLDLNHDGEIDPDEVMHYEDYVVPQLRVESIISATDLPGGEHEEHFDDESNAGRFGLLRIPEPVASADTNFDRGVSVDEFRAAAAQRFQLLDFNNAGRLTLGGLQNVRIAAASNARRKRDVKAGESDEPTSAEYGGVPPDPQ
jgi:Ca2+-binding EF-hand superfamily protein